jgi:hypothetical protein
MIHPHLIKKFREVAMVAKITMLAAWMVVNNLNRQKNDDLNLTVGGTIQLNAEALRLLGEQLLTIKIDVLDADWFSDDKLKTDQSFQLAIHDTNPHCFNTGVLVNAKTLNDCEWWGDDTAEVYCVVSASRGNLRSNGVRTAEQDVPIY